MRCLRFAASVLLSFLVASASLSAEPALKIGTVSFQKALNEVEQGKTAKKTLRAEFDAKQKKLDLQQTELKKLKDELERQKAVLSPESLRERERSLGEKFMTLQQNLAAYQQELVGREGKVTQTILQNLRTIVREIGEKEKFALIVEVSQDAVLFASQTEDLTDRVISTYNKTHRGPIKVD